MMKPNSEIVKLLREIDKKLDCLVELLEDLVNRDGPEIIYELGEDSTVAWPADYE